MRTNARLTSVVVQAPMAGAQSSALAVAVSNAGGIGSLPCAMLSPTEIRREIASIKAQTSTPFNVNFFCHETPSPDEAREHAWRERLLPYYREFGVDPTVIRAEPARRPFDGEMAAIIEELKPPIVSFHFGLPAPDLLDRVRATGAAIWSSATTVEEARWLDARGVHAIIAQGSEAGGHRGMFLSDDLTTQVGTLALVPQIVRAVGVPVIAAGGIADAAGVRAALALGAAAAQVGTAYLRCPEVNISAVHREALAGAGARHTAITNVFTGRPARSIVNRAVRELGPLNPATPPFPLAVSWMLPLRAKAEANGSGDFSPLWAGQNAAGAVAMPAGDVTARLRG